MKKLNLSGISQAVPAAADKHPVVKVDEETLTLLEQFTVIAPQFKTLENQKKTLNAQLGPRIRAAYFHCYAGIGATSSTLLCQANGRTVKLITKNKYSSQLPDEAPLIAALGPELTSRYFRQSTVLKLDLEKVPDDKQEAFASGVIQLAQQMGVTEAVSASQCIQPTVGFHEARTSILTPELNMALDQVLPVVAYAQL